MATKQNKWIEKAISKPGALRATLHVKQGQNIPESKLKQAENSKNKTTAKRAVLARTLRGIRR